MIDRIDPTRKDFLKLNKYIQAGKMCDLGSASGLTLDIGSEFNFDTIGVEPNPNMKDNAIKHYGNRWIPLT